MNKTEHPKQNYSTAKLCYKLLDDSYFDENGRVKEELKFKINNLKFKIQNSKLIGKPEDKFETMLFLPEGEGRKGEGGLRTKGYFKFSYKLVQSSAFNVKDTAVFDNVERRTSSVEHCQWYLCDLDGNLVEPAPSHIQQEISKFLSQQSIPDQPVAHHMSLITNHQSPVTIPECQFPTPDSRVPPVTCHLSHVTKMPLITVITVVYNGEEYLEQTVQSVINQTYPNVEYIIVDGGSTDGTLDIIKKYEDYVDYWVSERDKGIYDAMNKGIDLTMGKWINFMNVGDMFYNENVLRKIFSYFINDDIEIIYGNVIVDFENYSIFRKAYNINKIKYCMPFQHQSSFTKSSIIKRCKFDINFNLASDYNFFLYQYQDGKKFYCSDNVIAKVSAGGVSDSARDLVRKEYYFIQKKNNIVSIKNTIYYYYMQNLEYVKKMIKSMLPGFVLEFIRRHLR